MAPPVKKHAVFSPSEKYWVNYDRARIIQRYDQVIAIERGTALHELAAKCIDLKIHLDPCEGVIATYVSDCISYKMDTEVELVFTNEINGTADAIRYDRESNTLYVFDLKTGSTKASLVQVMIYAALWCCVHNRDPLTLSYDLRIYHNQYPEKIDTESDPQLGERINDIIVQMRYVASVINDYRKEE